MLREERTDGSASFFAGPVTLWQDCFLLLVLMITSYSWSQKWPCEPRKTYKEQPNAVLASQVFPPVLFLLLLPLNAANSGLLGEMCPLRLSTEHSGEFGRLGCSFRRIPAQSNMPNIVEDGREERTREIKANNYRQREDLSGISTLQIIDGAWRPYGCLFDFF